MQQIKTLLLLIWMIDIIIGQTFSVNLNDSLLLDQNGLGISLMSKDFQGNYMVIFEDGSAKRFTANFTSYTNLTFPEAANYYDSRGATIATTLSNGSSLSMNTRNVAYISNNFTTIRDYNYYTFTNDFTYQLNETIYSDMGFALLVSGVQNYFHSSICSKSIKVSYGGVVTNELNFSSIFGANSDCIASINYNYPISYSGDYFYANFVNIVSLSNNNVYKFNINLTFRFNFTINHYNFYAWTYSYTLLYSSPTPITFLKATNSMLYMQSNSTGATAIYNFNTSQVGTTSNIPTNQTYSFFYVYGAYYVLQSTGIYTLSYNSAGNILSYLSKVTSLPQNFYSFLWGSYLDAFYVHGQPYVYKAGICQGQSFMNGTSCVNYSCSIDNCSSCNISPTFCSVCNSGFQLNSNYACTYIDQTTNATNNTNAVNSTSNITKNATLIEFIRNSFSFLGTPLLGSQEALSSVISFPAARKLVSPFFIYFGVFDDLYLFQFHDRVYGNTMNKLFSSINDIQSKKWSFINYQDVITFFGFDINVFGNVTNYQDEYNYFPFRDVDHVFVGPEGLWGNCQNFFIVALPFTFVAFLLLRGLFRLLYNYSISKILRNFQFWPYLYILLFDGNIQQMGFYMATDWKNMFYFDQASKWMKIQVVYFGFIFFFLSTCVYFLSYIFYSKLNNYLMQNNKNSLSGQALLIIQCGFKNMFSGILHSVLRRLDYRAMISLLLLNQIIFTTVFMIAVSRKHYKIALKIWFYTYLNILKMLSVITLLADYRNVDDPTIEAVQLFLIILMVGIYTFGGFIEAFIILKEIFFYFKRAICKEVVPIIEIKEKQKTKKFYENELSRNGVIVYVKNIGEQGQTHPLKRRRFGFKQKINPPPVNTEDIDKKFNSFPHFGKSNRVSNDDKKKFLKIKFISPNPINSQTRV